MKRDTPIKKRRPTVKDMITRPFFHEPTISPDGKKVAYTKIELDLSNNGMTGKFYIYDVETQKTHCIFADGAYANWLDNNRYSVVRHSPSGNPRWSDIYIVDGPGEGTRIGGHSSPLMFYVPFADGFVYLASNSSQTSHVGDFVHAEKGRSSRAVYYVSTERAIRNEEKKRKHFEEEAFSAPLDTFEITTNLNSKYHITSVVVSPNNDAIYLNCQIGTELIHERDTICFKVELDPESILGNADGVGLEKDLSSLTFHELALPKEFILKAVSPDGTTLLLTGPVPGASVQPRDDLWLISDSDAFSLETPEDPFTHLTLISEKLDRVPQDVHWTKNGIYVAHWEESRILISQLFESGEFKTFDFGPVSPKFQFSINDNGDIAFCGVSPTAMQEVYAGSLENGVERVTTATKDFAHLDLGTVESIRWTSKDGTEIEGILRKPSDFDPSKKYPLLLYPHGGPRVSSFLSLTSNEFAHPVHSLLAKGVLILEPNYRGSIGRGREFMDLNQNNLGVHDMWDLESGIDYLIEQGFVDENRIGSLGGSQGGYLSAFIGIHTDRCAAVAVFAGVSSWYLYYIGSDSRHTVYLNGTPFEPEAREAYRESAPISAIDRAKTPMLLHHGDRDERITVVSSQEMYRALKDKGVHTELFILPGKGHGFPSPRENYSISLHEYRWFCHYLLGEDLDLFKDDF
ncbi:MAG: prolyl oligopeptidase family serine peptidase [Candidatus Thorarchaeota archaeon]